MKILFIVDDPNKGSLCTRGEKIDLDIKCYSYVDISAHLVKETFWDLVLIEESDSKELTQFVCGFFADNMKTPIILWVRSEAVAYKEYYSYGATDILEHHSEEELILKLKAMNHLLTRQGLKKKVQDRLVIENSSRRVYISGDEVKLANKEFEILYLMKSEPDRVFNKVELYSEIWNQENFGDYVTVAVHIRRIRTKLQTVSDHEYIETVRGVGYRYVAG